MFIHNLKYSLKILFKNKMLIFWTFAFPILLGTFFYLAMSDIEKNEKLSIIDIAVVLSGDTNDNIYKETFDALSLEGENKLFNTKYVTEDNAIKLLENNKISGYVVVDDKVNVVVNKSGINETILKYVTEEISQSVVIIKNIIETSINNEEIKDNAWFNNLYEKVENMSSNVEIENISSSNLSYTMIEYYTLIAMACLYGAIFALTSINQSLANMSSNGKRVSVSPTSKSKIILSSLLASYIIQIIGLVLLFLYTIFVLNVDYGDNLPQVILLALVGALAGLTLGLFVGSVFKTNENVKTGIVISLTMLGCFLSGMMGVTMKYIVDVNVPIINKINPASMITDGFYSLYYYDTLDRYYFNIISLLIFALIMVLISMFSLRRQKYDSI